MVTKTADPADVRLEYSVSEETPTIDDPTIEKLIDKKARAIERELGDDLAVGSAERGELEAILTAIHITTKLDRSESKASVGPASATYDKSHVDQLRADARALGANDALLGIGGSDKTATIDVPRTRE